LNGYIIGGSYKFYVDCILDVDCILGLIEDLLYWLFNNFAIYMSDCSKMKYHELNYKKDMGLGQTQIYILFS